MVLKQTKHLLRSASRKTQFLLRKLTGSKGGDEDEGVSKAVCGAERGEESEGGRWLVVRKVRKHVGSSVFYFILL